MADTITVALRKALYTKLHSLCSDTSYRAARGTHAGNFVVFELSSVIDDETLWQTTLEVNVLGGGQNTTGIETLSDEIWEALDHWYYLVSDIGFTCYQQSRAPVTEDEDTLNHIRLTFSIRWYK